MLLCFELKGELFTINLDHVAEFRSLLEGRTHFVMAQGPGFEVPIPYQKIVDRLEDKRTFRER